MLGKQRLEGQEFRVFLSYGELEASLGYMSPIFCPHSHLTQSLSYRLHMGCQWPPHGLAARP